MNFFQSIDFMACLVCILAGIIIGFILFQWHTRRRNRMYAIRRLNILSLQWRGFERPEAPEAKSPEWEHLFCDKRTPEHPSVLYQECNPPAPVRDRKDRKGPANAGM